MTEKTEQFYQLLYQELTSRLGNSMYKNVNVVPLKIQFYLNTIVNSATFINRIGAASSREDLALLVERYYENYFNTKGFFQKLKLTFKDLTRYCYHQVFYRSERSNADFFVLITNKKFFSFTKPIIESLEQNGKKVSFLLWDKNDFEGNIKEIKHFPKTNFPDFWNKDYFVFHEIVTLIDRANGFLPLLKNKKLILVEGDLESHHILGLLGKNNEFKTYCLQWGFFGKTTVKTGWRNMPFDKFLVWGDFFLENFKVYNPNLNIVSCGHPLLKENMIFQNDKVILFALQKQFGEHISTQNVLDYIHFAAKIATQLSEYVLIVRSHPDFEISESLKYEYQSIQNIIWHDYKNFSLNQSFAKAKYCVSISSTVSLESIAYGCFPIYLKINNLPLQIHQLFENSEYKHVFDLENFVQGIQDLETQNLKIYLGDFKNKLYKNLGTLAVNAIVSEINS